VIGTAGCRDLDDIGATNIAVDTCTDAEAAAEGAVLSLWGFDDLKKKKKTKVDVTRFEVENE
jgi:aminopeptidase